MNNDNYDTRFYEENSNELRKFITDKNEDEGITNNVLKMIYC